MKNEAGNYFTLKRLKLSLIRVERKSQTHKFNKDGNNDEPENACH